MPQRATGVLGNRRRMLNYTEQLWRLMHDVVRHVPKLSFIDTQELFVFARHGRTGADGAFDLYEDDGHSMDYTKGRIARTRISQRVITNGNRRMLSVTMDAPAGNYSGMPKTRRVSFSFHAKLHEVQVKAGSGSVQANIRRQGNLSVVGPIVVDGKTKVIVKAILQ
jgi:hypothetical protein